MTEKHIVLNFGDGWSCDALTGAAIRDVTSERERQIDKGWTREHDDRSGWEHAAREAFARLPEAVHAVDPRAELVKCAALLVAAIEVIDRNLSRAAAECDACRRGAGFDGPALRMHDCQSQVLSDGESK